LGQSQPLSVEARLKDAVIQAFAEDGVAGLDAAAICARAETPEADLRARWPDGWALLLDAVDERWRLPELPDTGSLEGDLIAYARDYARLCADPALTRVFFYLAAEVKSDPTLWARVEPGFIARRARNHVLIERAVARGELPPSINGDAILDALLSLGTSWNGAGRTPADAEIRCAVEAVIAQARDGGKVRAARARADPAKPYRLYLFDRSPQAQSGRIAEVEALAGPSDSQAIAVANARRSGRYAELWKESHLIRIFDPE
jgi:AcrR family transcriptional regulator